jgi:hypothetical protein
MNCCPLSLNLLDSVASDCAAKPWCSIGCRDSGGGRGGVQWVFNLGNWVTAFEIRGADLVYCPANFRRLFSGKYNAG